MIEVFVIVVCVYALPSTVRAFDYGPVGNGVFWVLLALWSMCIAYIVLTRRQRLLNATSALSRVLFARDPVRRVPAQRNPHIYIPRETDVPRPAVQQSVQHMVRSVPAPQDSVYVLPAHVSVPHVAAVQNTPVPPVHMPKEPVVESMHMSATPLPVLNPLAPKVPADEVQGSTEDPKTVDTLTLDTSGLMPRLVLKRTSAQ